MKLRMHFVGLLLLALLIPSFGCGAHAKPRPNDEVTVPMSEEDEAALGGESTPDALEADDVSEPDETPEPE